MARNTASAQNGLTTTLKYFIAPIVGKESGLVKGVQIQSVCHSRVRDAPLNFSLDCPGQFIRGENVAHSNKRLALAFCALALTSLLPGCGLDEYEKQMEYQQQRLDYLEEENKLLEPQSMKLPPIKDGSKIDIPETDFFFRPPKGISTVAGERPASGLLYTFEPTASSQKSSIIKIMAAMAKRDLKSTKDSFKADVLAVLGITGKPTIKNVRTPTGRKQVDLEVFEEQTPKEITRAYFNKTDPLCEAVVVIRMTPAGAADPALEKALGTFMTGTAAFNQHRVYNPVAGEFKAPKRTRSILLER
jgi:hypothetical protein